MSVANLLGRSSATGATKLTFADGLGDVFVKSLNTAKITAFDPLLLPIVINGGMDFQGSGGIEGITGLETPSINSTTQQVMELSGSDVIFTGNMVAQGGLDVSGILELSDTLITAKVGLQCDMGIGISGEIGSVLTNSMITFGTGIPNDATNPGSVYIRSDGATNAEVIYVNASGGEGAWSALS